MWNAEAMVEAPAPGAVLVVEDEPAIADAIAARLARRGLRVETAARRAARRRRGRGLRARRRRARRHAPRLRRPGGLPAHPGRAAGARPHAHRARRRDRHARRARRRRRRLHDQAVLHARAGRPGARRCCAGSSAPTPGRPPTAVAEPPIVAGDLVDRPRPAPRHAAGDEVHLTPTEFDLLVMLAATPADGAHPRAAARRGLGLGRRVRAPARSTPTSRRCAASSAPS